MYSYEELKKQLSEIDELDFIFTNPTFIKKEKEQKQERQFEIDNYTQPAMKVAAIEGEKEKVDKVYNEVKKYFDV